MGKSERKFQTLVDSEGNLDRKIPLGGAVIPMRIYISRNRLVWDASNLTFIETPPPTLLESFVKLGDESTTPKDIGHFAKKFGILGLCKHGSPGRGALSYGPIHSECKALGMKGYEPKGWEPLEAWYFYAAQARAILEAVPKILDNKPADSKTMETINRAFYIFRGKTDIHPDNYRRRPWLEKASLVEYQKYVISSVVDSWLEASKPHPTLLWYKNVDPKYEFTSLRGGLFYQLAVQLLLAVCGSDSFATCHGCKLRFPVRERPRSGERSYCDNCREKNIHGRDAQKDYRDRIKSALTYFSEGFSIGEVVERLSKKRKHAATPKKVKHWVIQELVRRGHHRDVSNYSDGKLRDLLQGGKKRKLSLKK